MRLPIHALLLLFCCVFAALFFAPTQGLAQEDQDVEEQEPKEEKKKKRKEKLDLSHTEATPDRYGRTFGEERPKHHDYDAPMASVKIYPALFWNTIGLEYEHTLAAHFTVAGKGYYNYGNLESPNDLLQDKGYNDPGYLVDLMVKFYWHRTPQKGPYIGAGAAYGNLLYFDGNYRPFTVLSRREEANQSDILGPTSLEKATPFHFLAGMGYQISLPFRGLCGNVFAGVQGSLPESGGIAPQFFIEPGIGITFGGNNKEDQ